MLQTDASETEALRALVEDCVLSVFLAHTRFQPAQTLAFYAGGNLPPHQYAPTAPLHQILPWEAMPRATVHATSDSLFQEVQAETGNALAASRGNSST